MKTKTTLSPTNPRPECAGDAPQVSNDMYNKRNTREKLASRYKQSGRSMIEMLGVLAIIGVLTVGSIAGYSHAMRRHLLNKQREQISYILATIETQYDALKTSLSNLPTSNNTSLFINLGWIPEKMIEENNNSYIYDVFKNKALFWINQTTTSSKIGFYIYLNNGNAFEQCINLYQATIPFSSSLWGIEIHRDAGYSAHLLGDNYCYTGGSACIRNSTTPSNIARFCQACKDNNRCNIYYIWSFYR